MAPPAGNRRKRPKLAARKRRRLVRRRPPPGSAPGTIVVDPVAPPATIRVLAYGPDGASEAVLGEPGEIAAWLAEWPVVWVDLDGLGSEEQIRAIGDVFGLHRLVLEDVAHTGQRAKVEAFETYLYIVAHQALGGDLCDTEQVSVVLGHGFVLTLQERPGDVFEPVRERLRQAKGMIRQRGADYLAYALVDAVIDSYFPVLERVGEMLEELEDEVLSGPTNETPARIHAIRRDLLALRKSVWPHRDMTNTLIRDSGPFVTEDTRVFLRDCYDHAIRIIDLVEAFREMTSDLMNTYLTAVSNRMNEIMKVLTIIATIFIPLSFIAGLYGMNFDPSVSRWNMPELGWPFGYAFALG
ncbi:MAG: magnesium/cobalt transporter CorA, partial [Gemmatimonadota bacterium]|nr:magnesium/cobalt transporter CorA [Gemmatimonadota bacterium]